MVPLMLCREVVIRIVVMRYVASRSATTPNGVGNVGQLDGVHRGSFPDDLPGSVSGALLALLDLLQ